MTALVSTAGETEGIGRNRPGMTSVKRLIAGNWKMNGLRAEALALARAVAVAAAGAGEGCAVAVFPPFTALEAVAAALAGSPVGLGGQDCHEAEAGGHTGSVSAAMLADLGCRYVIVGHSERRHGLGETSGIVCAKAEAALGAGLVPIVCVGETLEQREAGQAEATVAGQIARSVPDGDGRIVLAYEPVWAIGTGRTASTADIAAMHAGIRARLAERRGDGGAIPILYGGSVKPDNAAEILALANVGGVLVGGASLDAVAFAEIVRAAG